MDGLETDTSDTEPDVKLEPYKLTDQCKRFKSKNDLGMQIRNTHLLQESQCHQCGKCFHTRKALESILVIKWSNANYVNNILKLDGSEGTNKQNLRYIFTFHLLVYYKIFISWVF